MARCSKEWVVVVLWLVILLLAPVLVVVGQCLAQGEAQGPLAVLVPDPLAAEVQLVVAHPYGLGGVCFVDTRCLPLGSCNSAGLECLYMFQESIASPQEVAILPSPLPLGEEDHVPAGYNTRPVLLFSPSVLEHRLLCHTLVSAGSLSLVAVSDIFFPKIVVLGLSPALLSEYFANLIVHGTRTPLSPGTL